MFKFKFLSSHIWAAIAAPVVLIGVVAVVHQGFVQKVLTLTPAALQNFLTQEQTQTSDSSGHVQHSANSNVQTQAQTNSSGEVSSAHVAKVPSKNHPAHEKQNQETDANPEANDAAGHAKKENSLSQRAHIARVIDGDTVILSTGEHLRYIGINTPEIAHDNSATECFGEEATERDRELVEGKDVTLTDGPDTFDIYGRLLRYVWLGDTLINQELVAEGYARADDYGHPHQYDAQFEQAQQNAKIAGLGLWAACVKKTAEKKDARKDSDNSAPKQRPAPQINQSLVINEVRPQGNEFVELYNLTDTPTSLAGYYFAYYSHTKTDWADPTRAKAFPDDATIPAQGFYLIAFGNTSFSSPKENWAAFASDTLANAAGTVAFFAGDPRTAGSTRIDAFGWGDTLLFEFAPVLDTAKNGQTFARPTDRSELNHNNNSFDFRLTTIATPGKGNILLDPQNDPTLHPAASSGTVTPAQVLISEVLVNGAEFVELYNPTAQAQNLAGHYFDYYSSSRTQWNDPLSDKQFPDSASVPALGYFLIDVDGGNYPKAQWTPASFSSLNNSYGTIAIFSADPKSFSTSLQAQAKLVDAVAWGNDTKVTLKETKTALAPPAGQSISRNLQKKNTNDNSKDFFVTAATPGSTNAQANDQQDSPQNAPQQNDNLSDVVINEIETGDSEFVELFNPSVSAVDLSGYFFAYYSSSKSAWSDPHRLKQFPSGASIPAQGFYLIGLNYVFAGSSPVLDWQPYTNNTLANDSGTVAIFSSDPTALHNGVSCDILPTDAVGWGSAQLFESGPAKAPAANQGISRNGSHDDTDNNFGDFKIIFSPTPMNSSM